ncbi:MAG: hypothetical protein ISS44_01700 [Candidatus Omnitrophica bacterium]|nr:hypothetical protein [Candidatus Omnitrophota bacterium]
MRIALFLSLFLIFLAADRPALLWGEEGLPPGEAQEPSLVTRYVEYVEYTAGGCKDPFGIDIVLPKDEEVEEEAEKEEEKRDVSYSSSSLPSLALKGVIWQGPIPLVIINDQVLKKGDTIKGATIVKIDEDSVTLIYQNRPFRLLSPAKQEAKDEK